MERDSNGDIHSDSNELTGQAQSAYSKEGGNIMPDGSSGPGPEGKEKADEINEEDISRDRVKSDVEKSEERKKRDTEGSAKRTAQDDTKREEFIKTSQQEAREQLLGLPIPKPIYEPGISNKEMQDRRGHKDAYDIIAPDQAKKAGLLGKATWKGPDGEKAVEVIEFSKVEAGKIHLKIKIGDEIKEVTEDELVYPEDTTLNEDSGSGEGDKEESEDNSAGAPLEKPPVPPSGESEHGDGEGHEEAGEDSEAKTNKEVEDDLFLLELSKHLAKPAVKDLLRNDKPDFYQAGLEDGNPEYSRDIAEFVEFIDKKVESGGGRRGTNLITFTELMSRKNGFRLISDGAILADIELSDTTRKLLFEWSLEKIISIPDITPDSGYELDLQDQQERTALIKIAKRNFSEDQVFIHEMGKLVEARKGYHNLRYLIPLGEKYLSQIQDLRTDSIHYGSNNMAGVSNALRFHERLNSEKLARVRRWFSAKDISEVDSRVRERMEKLWKEGGLKKDGRKLTGWELERAIQIANTIFNGTQRQTVYEGAGEVPADAAGRMGSTKTELSMLRALFTFKSSAVRYFASIPGSNALLNHFIERRVEQEEREGKSTSRSIYGLNTSTIILDQMGAPDLRSHSWRNPIMHFTAIKIRRGENDRVSLLELLNENGASISEDSTLNPPEKPSLKETNDVEAAVLGQDLYLSALVGYGDLSAGLKAKIWQKRAILNPAAIVAFRPEIISEAEQSQWDAIAEHLDIAFTMWVDNEYEQNYRNGMSMAQLRSNRDAFRNGVNNSDYRYQIINQEYLRNNLSESQLKFLRTVIDRAVGEADYLSGAKFPHIYHFDDTPYVSWKSTEDGEIMGLDDGNMFRLLLKDQPNLQEKGWAPLVPMFANLTDANGFAWSEESVRGLMQVIGIDAAQKWNRPMVLAVLDMMKAYPKALWLGEAMRIAGKPRSEFEKYTGDKIFLDEEARANILESLVTKSVIDSKELGLIKRMMGASELHKLKGKARGIFQILLLLIPAAIIMGIVKEAGEGAKEAQG